MRRPANSYVGRGRHHQATTITTLVHLVLLVAATHAVAQGDEVAPEELRGVYEGTVENVAFFDQGSGVAPESVRNELVALFEAATSRGEADFLFRYESAGAADLPAFCKGAEVRWDGVLEPAEGGATVEAEYTLHEGDCDDLQSTSLTDVVKVSFEGPDADPPIVLRFQPDDGVEYEAALQLAPDATPPAAQVQVEDDVEASQPEADTTDDSSGTSPSGLVLGAVLALVVVLVAVAILARRGRRSIHPSSTTPREPAEDDLQPTTEGPRPDTEAPPTPVWMPTHRIPPSGLQAFADPYDAEPIAVWAAGREVHVDEVNAGWAHVTAENGAVCWVNEHALVALDREG